MRYKGDPRWISVRYAGICARCHAPINRQARAFYYPQNSVLYCDREDCGKAAARDFEACAFDEDQYNSN